METTPTNLIPASPLDTDVPAEGSGEAMSAAEESLVEDAVTHLNATAKQSGLALARDVSAYVIARFFDGDYQNFSDPSRHKPRSFSALCRRTDLELSASSLYALIRVGQQLDQLPNRVAQALTLKHHRALLPLEDDAERTRLAQDAVTQHWTAAELSTAVRAARTPSNRGRTPLPSVVKSIRALRRSVPEPPDAVEITTLSSEYRQELVEHVAAIEALLDTLRTALAT